MIPTDNAPLFENDPQKPIKIWKCPSAKWPAPLTGNNGRIIDQPLRYVKDAIARI